MPNREDELRDIVHKYINIGHKQRKVMKRRLEQTGVFESQHRLLMVISKHNEFSQKRLAEVMKISTATIAVTLKKLEKGGYVKRMANEEDNRYNTIEITKKGRQVVEESEKIFRSMDEAMFHGFSKAELKEFKAYLDRVYVNLDAATDLEGGLK